MASAKRQKLTETSRTLVIVRHGQSEWNRDGMYTGWVDVDLTETGAKQCSVQKHHAFSQLLDANSKTPRVNFSMLVNNNYDLIVVFIRVKITNYELHTSSTY